MKLVWTRSANADLAAIADYLIEQTPLHAPRLVRDLYQSPEILQQFPMCGRPGRVTGTRELVLAPLPYVVIYRVGRDAIEIIRILHGAQRWP